MRPAADLNLVDRYRFVERIAVGGMGEVWLARDEVKQRDVAIKVLREEFTGEAGFVNRFRAEARATAGLSHPGIAQTYAYGEQSGSAYIVMELVVAEPLSETLEREKTIAPEFTVNILSQAARALHAAHEGGVVHRDVKPGNILVDQNGRVKLTDFGIARAVGQPAMTEVGMVMGTAQYLSPEQVNGRPATAASDIYALGIVAYEMLVGNRPFTGTTPLQIAIRHVEDAVPPLSLDVPKPLADLVMRALDKDASKRPETAAVFADELESCLEFLQQQDLQTVPATNKDESPLEPVPSEPRRRKREVSRRKAVATWTGQRLSWLSPPLLALLLLIIFAAIGSLIAGKIFAAGPMTETSTGIMAQNDWGYMAPDFLNTSNFKDA